MESIEVVELFSQIDAAVEQEEHDRALRLILSNFDTLADPAPLRERVAAVLADTGRVERALAIYRRVGMHYMHAGHPARALMVMTKIEDLGSPNSEMMDRFTALYNRQSPFLDPTRRHAGIGVTNEQLDVQEHLEVETDGDLENTATERALQAGLLVDEPADDLPPLPVLSQLSSDDLETVARKLEFETFDDLTPLEFGDDADGSLVWTVTPDLTLGNDDPTYHLRPGSLVGLDTITGPAVGNAPTVYARNGSSILRLPADSVADLRESLDGFDEILATVARRGAVEALLESHSMFEVIAKDERNQLLDQFEGLAVDAGTRLVEQDASSPGLFLIVDGEVDIIREDEDWEITVETLGAGDVFGEIGLVSDRPTPADVVTTDDGHILHLPSAAFEAVASEQPALAKWAVNLAQDRLAELESTLSAQDLAEIPD